MINSFESIIAASERVAWTLDEVMPSHGSLDFTRRFLPEVLVGAQGLGFLSEAAQLKLNQVRGNAYAHVFQFVEEYIVAACLRHVENRVFADENLGLRAMLRFAEEELKHQQMFQRFGQLFARDFGTPCGGIGSQKAVAALIVSKDPMAVMILTLHLEVMTQHHYTQCVQSTEGLDPTFKLMLKSHWVEEAQHAKIDAMTLRKLALTTTPAQRRAAVLDYLGLLDALAGLLDQQVEFDVASLESAAGSQFNAEQKEALLATQRRSYRQIFIVWGLTNPSFIEMMEEVFPEDAAEVKARAAAFA